MSEEEWRPVPGDWPYEVSDRGRVRRSEPGVGTYAGRVLKPQKMPTGYESVSLCNNGESQAFRVHHLVLRAFLGPCPEGCETDHINSVRDDNRLENLRWLDIGENRRHAGEDGTNASLTRDEVIEIRVNYETCSWASHYTLADQYGVGATTVEEIVRSVTWTEAPGPIQARDEERDAYSELNANLVRELRRRYESEPESSYYSLADEYGLHPSTVGRIVRRERWAHLSDRHEDEGDEGS